MYKRQPLGIPLIVDNTAAPVICKPFDHGAAISMHSTTKYIGGHGTSIGGIIVDSGNFDWEAHPERQPALNNPDPSYGGAVWTEAVKPLGPIAYILKARTTILRDMGAAISMHSTTKYIGGHGTSIGGIIVDSGNFDWEAHPDRQPALNNPDPSYGGAVWTEAVKPLGPIAYILKARTTILRDMGSAMSPFNAFMFIQGLETLALRIREHSKNADEIAKFLMSHPKVERVSHPSIASDLAKERADKYLSGGCGGLMGFEIKGGVEAGKQFINSLEMFYHVANIGDSRSLAIHPASTTHSQLNEEELLSAGVTPGYVRLSIGLEHLDDIKDDLSQALDKVSV